MARDNIEDKPLYCYACGRATVEKKKFDHFDGKTGERVYHTIIRCPRYWWIDHLNYEYNEEGYLEHSWW